MALIVLCISVGGGAGCSILLDSSANPYKCVTDDDCSRFPDAVCDAIFVDQSVLISDCMLVQLVTSYMM